MFEIISKYIINQNTYLCLSKINIKLTHVIERKNSLSVKRVKFSVVLIITEIFYLALAYVSELLLFVCSNHSGDII